MRAWFGVVTVVVAMVWTGVVRAESGRGFIGFVEALGAAQSGAGPARILWYGDSAIVSDGYTRVVRQRLQERFGDGGPGFVLAAEPFEGYLRDGVRMKRSGWRHGNVIQDEVKNGRYGLGGVVAAGAMGASLTLEPQRGDVGGIEVYVQRGPKAGVLGVFVGGAKEPVASYEAASDELRDDVWVVNFEAPTSEAVRVTVMRGVVRVYGASLETGRGVQLDALGILGIRARRWLNADAAHVAGQVGARRPALLVVNFGGNERVDAGLTEAGHAEDLERVIAHLRAGAPEAACLVMGPLIHGVSERGAKVVDPKLKVLYAAQMQAARKTSCEFLDTMELMGGHERGTLLEWRRRKWISGDYAHLTPAGHAELGRRLADWLLAKVESHGERASQ